MSSYQTGEDSPLNEMITEPNVNLNHKTVPHGAVKRIAELANVSKTTVSKVLAQQPGISNAMRQKVAKAAKTVLRAFKRENDKTDRALSGLSL